MASAELPLPAPRDSPASPVATAADDGPRYFQLPPEEIRICIAEDNRVNRRLMEKVLDKLCYSNFHMYHNGRDAVDGIRQMAAEGEPYHVVLMDLSMPVMGGWEATRLLRRDENPAVRDVPVVPMHACSSQSGTLQFSAAGMSGFLSKPMRKDALAAAIETYGNPPRLVEAAPEPEVVDSEMDPHLAALAPRL